MQPTRLPRQSAFKVAVARNLPVTIPVSSGFSRLCLWYVCVSSRLYPGGLFVGGLFVSVQYAFWLSLCFSGWFIHPNYDHLIKSGGDTSKPLVQTVLIARKPCHLSNLNKMAHFTQKKPKQSSKEIPYVPSRFLLCIHHDLVTSRQL